jgi:hypothetical protein
VNPQIPITVYTLYANVARVERKTEVTSGHKAPNGEAVLTTRELGWFVQFVDSRESLYFGQEEPQLKVGDRVKITFEKQ